MCVCHAKTWISREFFFQFILLYAFTYFECFSMFFSEYRDKILLWHNQVHYMVRGVLRLYKKIVEYYKHDTM